MNPMGRTTSSCDPSAVAVGIPPASAARTEINPTETIRVHHLYVAAAHNYFGHHGRPPGDHPIIERAALECFAGRGVRGDRFFDYKDNYNGQITFFARETYAAICDHLNVYQSPPSVFRRNVITSGVDLNGLIGRDFWVQDVLFHGTEECRPCHWMDQAFAPGAFDYLKGRGGLRAIILKDGILRVTP
jgi:MOSC domain-containing protein YiiM